MTHNIEYLNWTFTPDKIREGNLYLVTSLLSSALEVNTLFAAVECSDPSILDFERNAPLLYYTSPDLPMIFRVQNIKRVGPGIYEISATSTLGLLTEGLHYGGIYTGQTAQEVIASICGTVPFIIKNNLAGTKLYGWLPIAAPRDNLSQVLFAIGAALKTDLDGVLRIAGLWDGVSGTVGRDELYQEARAEYAAKVTQVLLTEHQYVEGVETAKLFEGTAQEGDIITFNEPMHSLTAEGFTVLEGGANYAKVSAGSGTLTGKKYIHNTRLITRAVQTANTPNVKTVDKATLVSLVNSAAVADRLAAFYKCTQTIDAPVVYSGENPGDVLSVYHPYDKSAVSACLQSADITLSGTLKAQEKSLVGFEPLQSEDSDVRSQSELLTGSGTWAAPENILGKITLVLIGGGNGGGGGNDGGDGLQNVIIVTNADFAKASIGTRWTSPAKNGGAGGDAGIGGGPGKVFVTELEVSAGDSISYSCGTGGAGGEANGGNGATGGETIFGSISSSAGSVSSAGYTDITTGNTYAIKGRNGTKGGKGGNGGTASSYVGDDGEGVGEHEGGKGSKASDESNSQVTAYYYGSGGGGASADGNKNSESIYAQSGGDAKDAEPATIFGNGGTGGNGGGGAGSAGEKVVIKKSEYGSVWWDNPPSQPGGKGGAGGAGAPGCIILYYGVKKTVPAGQLVDKNNRMVLDRLGRRIIV